MMAEHAGHSSHPPPAQGVAPAGGAASMAGHEGMAAHEGMANHEGMAGAAMGQDQNTSWPHFANMVLGLWLMTSVFVHAHHHRSIFAIT